MVEPDVVTAYVDEAIFPEEAEVLLTRTQRELSIGMVSFLHRDSTKLLLYFDREVDPTKPSIVRRSIVSEVLPSRTAAIDRAMGLITDWYGNIGVNVTANMISYNKHSAPFESPHSNLDGSIVDRTDSIVRDSAMAQVRKSGIAVPIAPFLMRMMKNP